MEKRPRILIVDDEPFNVDYLEQELDELGYESLTAVNGAEALERIRNDSPDLVLLDIMMPIMDGFTVLEKAKADAATRNIPVIIISANNDLRSVVRGIQLGAEDYLPKPFEPVLLHARISSSLEKKRLRDREQLYLQSLERELNIAREIQKEFLPFALPVVTGWETGAYFKAAKDVAGDFYDAFTLPDGSLVCAVGDVCGKGVGAALFMTLFRSLIRATMMAGSFAAGDSQAGLPAAERLKHAISFTNNYVAQTHEMSNMFATVFICLVDVNNGGLYYINAGNDKPYLLRKDGSLEELGRTGPAVGAIEGVQFKVLETQMGAGDLLLAFTDGIPDCQSVDGTFYGRERALALMKQNRSGAEACVQQIGEDMAWFIGEAEQFDDITMLAIRKAE